MKGIILAGGHATRLYPITQAVSKQLLPVYDKPMIYYPLSVLMLAGIKDILIITTAQTLPLFKQLLDRGQRLGIRISYEVQDKPRGIADAFRIGQDFIGQDSVSLILGDNIFFGQGFSEMLMQASQLKSGAKVFAYYVKDPERYGVVSFNSSGKILSIKEKPKKTLSHWAITGLYFFDASVVKKSFSIKPSKRGELEITDILNAYLKDGQLSVEKLSRGYAWLDTGTYDALIDASIFIKTIEDRQGLKVGCIEEIAYHRNYITGKDVLKQVVDIKTTYGDYLRRMVLETEGAR